MQSQTLEPQLLRITAPNPSAMTYHGTQTYILGTTEVVVIDPGPNLPAHLDAILAAVPEGGRIAKILVTHSHLDHSPLARPLSVATGAPVLAAGPSDWGRSAVMAELAATGLIGGGEGVDTEFSPDIQVTEGEVISGPWGDILVLETPGHMANHVSYAWNGAVFSSDLVMGWSTSLVSPPDGDMGAFMTSTARLAARNDRIFYPGHGDPVAHPQERCAELLAHRRAREAQIIAALRNNGASTAEDLARRIYTEIPSPLLPAASRNVLAHLIELHATGQARCPLGLSETAKFELA